MVQKDWQNRGGENGAAVGPNFGAVLGFEHLESPEGIAIIELKLRQEHCNLHGFVHGGVLMSLMDAAGLWANALKDGSVPAAATASLNCNFLRGARSGKVESLRAEGEVTKRGRAIYFSSISEYASPGGDLVASGQGVYSIAPHRVEAG